VWNIHSARREYSTVPFRLQTINLLLLWWPGVELNHRHADFQSGVGGSRGLLISHLQRLPPLSPASPRHIYGTPNLNSTRSWHSNASRLLRHDFAVFPDVKWRAIHARGFTCIFRRSTQGASDTRSKAPGPGCLGSCLCLHKFFSRSCGVGPELSYTAQLSARGRYNRSKFTQLGRRLVAMSAVESRFFHGSCSILIS